MERTVDDRGRRRWPNGWRRSRAQILDGAAQGDRRAGRGGRPGADRRCSRGGHCLITGVPGLAKTLLVKTLARDPATSSFKRIQFTPDLMPADITGTEILDEEGGTRALRFVHGPIFAQIILADEINRTPPKTQAALLEAMQEYHVTAAGPDLPARAAVLRARDAEPDRARGHLSAARGAARSLHVQRRHDLPLARTTRCAVVTETTGADAAGAGARAGRRGHPRSSRSSCAQVLVAEEVARYAVRLVDASRPGRGAQLDFVDEVGEVGRRPARVAGAGARRARRGR